MSIFPFIDSTSTSTETNDELPMLKEYAYDFEKNELLLDEGGRTYMVEGNEALRIWIFKALFTERCHYTAYSFAFGSEIQDQVIGHSMNVEIVKLEIERFIIEGSFEIFEKTLELLRKQKSLYCLLEIMRLHILVGLKEKRDMSKEQEDIKILQSFFEEFGYRAQSQIYVPQSNEIMLEHVGQYLSTERKKVNFTQEKISDGICSVESYSRIENGRKPTRNNYKALTEKIGTENRYYIELVNTGNIDALLLRREISYELFMEKNERLPELLEETSCYFEDEIGIIEV